LDYGIDRKTTKRATMTLPYGSTQYSARTYVQEDLEDRIAKGAKEDTFDGEFQKAATWATPHLWRAIKDTVPGARETMDWLQQKAQAASEAGRHVEWTTPDGFLVIQHYREVAVDRKQLRYLGKPIEVYVASDGLELHKKRQRSGMAPNFVHSMDGNLLREYVRLAKEHGIVAHSLIHDSFGTHAGDVELMQQLIRRAFVEMYRDDVTTPLMDWLESIGADAGDSLAMRGFDMGLVSSAKYLFS